MDTYSEDNNSCPPDVPEGSVGSSVSSRLQDEYEELLKYAVVVPKVDIEDMPRVLTDSKKSFGLHRQTSFSEVMNTESDTDDGAQPVRKQGIVITPGKPRITDNAETPIQTIQSHPTSSPLYSAQKPQFTFNTRELEISSTGEDDSSEESESEMFERTVTSERPISENDLKQMEKKLNEWTKQLNSNIMEEVARIKIQLSESSRHQLNMVQSKHAGEINTAQNELEGMKELLHTYEVSIERKDGIISNLTRSLQNQKEKFDSLKAFTEWKINFAANKQEGYGMRLAIQHHQRSLKRYTWRMWHAIIVEKWRHRVEKACQAKAQEVCISLTNEYEAKLKALDDEYTAARVEVTSLHKQRDSYEETMKKAFMRGVCALNMEAMNMFHEPDESGQQQMNERENTFPPPTAVTQSASVHRELSRPVTILHEPTFSTAGKRSTLHQTGKRLQTTITAGKGRQVRHQGVLVERHDNTDTQMDDRPSSAGSSLQHINAKPGSKVKSGQPAARVVRIVK